MPLAELEQFVIDMGQPKFRAKQIQEWLFRGAPDFSVMKNLPENLRKDLDRDAQTLPCVIEQKFDSADGQTTKFLLRITGTCLGAAKQRRTNHQHEIIETVLMRTSYGNSVCVSSQAGCAMGCKFCASTLLGLRRNLTANEMLAQVLVAGWTLKFPSFGGVSSECEAGRVLHQTNNPPRRPTGATPPKEGNKPNGDPNNNDVSHIVVMGTGEPLQNTENLKGFLETANSKLGISWRRMTVSTCGLVPGINELIEWGRPVNLAISLHAPNDELRSRLMPVNNKYPIAAVMDAAFAHSEKTGRQLMIEYILLDAARPKESLELRVKSIDNQESQLSTLNSKLCNCAPEHAEQLAALLQGRNCMVNLIPWNAVAERGELSAPSGNAVHRFQDILKEKGIHTRIRRERGADIGSACGQLRLKSKASQ